MQHTREAGIGDVSEEVFAPRDSTPGTGFLRPSLLLKCGRDSFAVPRFPVRFSLLCPASPLSSITSS